MKFEGEVPKSFLGTMGFSLRRDGRYIRDEVDTAWIRCATIGSTRPKPDYAAGLFLSAFTKDEIQKLKNYASLKDRFCSLLTSLSRFLYARLRPENMA